MHLRAVEPAPRIHPAEEPDKLKVQVLTASRAQGLLSALRNKYTGRAEFQAKSRTLANLVLTFATENMKMFPCEVHTPVGRTKGCYLSYEIVPVPILRAGLAMHGPAMEMFPGCRSGVIGLRRDEKTAVAECYYCTLPDKLASCLVLLMDPMLATGGSACDAIARIKEAHATQIRLVNFVAAPEGVRRVNQEHPDVEIYTAALDERLNDQKYIVPGLGDFGDRYFGTAGW